MGSSTLPRADALALQCQLVSEKRQTGAVAVRTTAVGYASGFVIRDHAHGRDQLIYGSRGVMTVYTPDGSWVVPPHRAVWVPAGVTHRIEMSGAVAMRSLYLAPGLAPSAPPRCAVVSVSPLLRELILHAVELRVLDRSVPAHERLVGVILDQIAALPAMPLQLPLPSDRRALGVARQLQENPADARPLDVLAKGTGASKRTLERLFVRDTDLSFARWRQQLRLLHAVRLLAEGRPVTAVALDVGYESPSAFIAMFKASLGCTPGQYFARPEPARSASPVVRSAHRAAPPAPR
jgi:AraC-like DNA-binding protein/quercetin dioxygenase-like cupin family protein